jgi:hypothetical protein
MANAIASSMAANLLNATLPVTAGGKPSATYFLSGGMSQAGAMFLRLNSTLSVGATEGTQITSGTGYTTNGLALGASSVAAPISLVETVTLPSAQLTWNVSGANFAAIAGLDITDNALVWSWYGPFNNQPIAVASGNSFAIAASAVVVTLT